MEGKDSFIFYISWFKYFDKLKTIEQRESLRVLLRDYVTDKYKGIPVETITSGDDVVDMAFSAIVEDLKTDLAKWKDTCSKRAEAGKLGGLKKAENRKQSVANLANAKSAKQDVANLANLADSEYEYDNDCDSDNEYLDKLDKLDKQYTHTHEEYSSVLRESIDKQKKHIYDNGLSWSVYMNLEYKIRPYYYMMKLNEFEADDVSNWYKTIEHDEVTDNVFFYTLDRVLKSEFKADNLIGYLKSVYAKNLKAYQYQLDNEGKTYF